VDLSGVWNLGDTNVKAGDGWIWPAGDQDPERHPLKRVPKGDQLFHGIPFALAEREEGAGKPAFVVAAKNAGNAAPESVSIPIGDSAHRILFAHCSVPRGDHEFGIESTGREIGTYTLVYADGTTSDQLIRRRFEVHDVNIPWGHRGFLCRPCREFRPMDLDDRSVGYGMAQVGVRGGGDGWWLYDMENPHPGKEIERIDMEAHSVSPFVLGGITLCDEDSDPFMWQPREDVTVRVDGVEGEPVVEMDRGVIARQDLLIVPNETFLTTDETGWGAGGQTETRGGHLEIHGSPEGQIKVTVGDSVKATVRWGDLLEKTSVTEGPVRMERVAPAGKEWVHVRVQDADTGKAIGCRVNFRSPHGVYFAPHGHQADVNIAWFEDMGGDCKVRGTPYAYIDGKCQIELPTGPVFVEVVRGFEYKPLRQKIHIKSGQRQLTLKMSRVFDMKERGYFSGDTHVHFLSAQSSHLEAAAEDLNVVNMLASKWGRLYTSWEEFTGGVSPTSSSEHLIYVSQENRQHVLGHISLLGLKELVAPMCTGGPQEDWIGGEVQTLMSDWAEACKKQGGLVIMPHMPLPDFENAANIILGHADAGEMCWDWRGEEIGNGEKGYYRWLNAGQKLPICGGTDKMSNGRILGGSRTYARVKDDRSFTFDNWCQAVREGNTFASTGAMIELHADGHEMGQEIALPGNGGTVEVVATAESVWPLTAVELIVNGKSVAREQADGDRRMVTIRYELKAERSCWVAARCWGPHYTDAGPVMAHSSPVFIDVGGRCAFNEADGNYLLTHMQGGVAWAEKIGVFRDEKVRKRLVELFGEAREELLRRAAE